MSDGLTDSYRMQDEHKAKQMKHHELLEISPQYNHLIEDIQDMRHLIEKTQYALNIIELQTEKLLTNYIKNS